MKKILFIGAGNMGQALIEGIIQKKLFDPKEIYVYELRKDLQHNIEKDYKVNIMTELNNENLDQIDIVMLAVKPQNFFNFHKNRLMDPLAEYIKKEKLIISIMASVRIKKILEFFTNNPSVIRIMPNTPLLIGKGFSGISPDSQTTEDQLEITMKIFSAVGDSEIVDEDKLDAITGISGSGVALVYKFIDAVADAGVLEGIPRELALRIVCQTVLGGAKMVMETGASPEILKDKVASPGGTTIEGLFSLEKSGFKGHIMQAVRDVIKKSKTIAAIGSDGSK
ncbi:MAG: pyrroline-5-carboxylate reductase [Spirochaetes bacterium]|nr:pyrroline-5-carboxylate reductase [Spirochaetota bacterium]